MPVRDFPAQVHVFQPCDTISPIIGYMVCTYAGVTGLSGLPPLPCINHKMLWVGKGVRVVFFRREGVFHRLSENPLPCGMGRFSERPWKTPPVWGRLIHRQKKLKKFFLPVDKSFVVVVSTKERTPSASCRDLLTECFAVPASLCIAARLWASNDPFHGHGDGFVWGPSLGLSPW